DLGPLFRAGEFDYVQSVFIDNKNNASTFSITFPGCPPAGHTIQAQPFTQGYYPVSPPVGDGRFYATAPNGQNVPVVFYNVPMPYVTWGPTPGVLVVPATVDIPIELAPAIAGDNVIVAAVALQKVRAYRLIINAVAPTNLKFWSGPSAGAHPLTGTFFL